MLIALCLFLTAAFDSTSYKPSMNNGLIVDLNADRGVLSGLDNRVDGWLNQVESFPVKVFAKQDEGRRVAGSGRPTLLSGVRELNGHNAIAFNKQELVADDEDAFDHLITGSGYTWFCVSKAGKQSGELPDVNSLFGNLRNGGHYEGFWAGLADNNQVWMGSRSGETFGRWDVNNPQVISDEQLDEQRFYVLIGRMDAGTGVVTLSLYIDDPTMPVATQPFPVNTAANASKLAIGQERDAIEHPGVESFVGEMARFLLYERPLTADEMKIVAEELKSMYWN